VQGFGDFVFHLRKGYRYENTRQYLRLPASWPIKCEPRTAADGKHVVRTKDVGAGGVAVIVEEMLPIGTHLHLEIHVPPLNRTIPAEGQVVRCLPARRGRGFELGVYFDQIDPKDRADLNEAIERSIGPRGRTRQRSTWWRKL